MKAVLTFTPDGLGHGLYTETVDLAALGALKIERASTIEFNGRMQQWEVRLASSPHVVSYSNPSRQACLDWEHKFFMTTDPL